MPKFYKYDGGQLKESEFANPTEALKQGYSPSKSGADLGMPLGNIFEGGNQSRYSVSGVDEYGVPIVGNVASKLKDGFFQDAQTALKYFKPEELFSQGGVYRPLSGSIADRVLQAHNVSGQLIPAETLPRKTNIDSLLGVSSPSEVEKISIPGYSHFFYAKKGAGSLGDYNTGYLKPNETINYEVDPNAYAGLGEAPVDFQAGNKVQVKNAKGETITVYEEDIPKLKEEGVIPTFTSLQEKTMQQAEQLGNNVMANEDYVRGLFKAWHGRSANQEELNRFTGKGVEDVFNAIKSGSPMAGGAPKKQATLYSPDGKAEIVDVGSERASELQSQGYTLEKPVSSIGADELSSGVDDINLPTGDIDTSSTASIIASAGQTSKTIQDYIDMLKTEKTENEKEYENILDKYLDDLEKTGDKATDQLTAEEKFKVNELSQQLAEINDDILTKVAEYEALKTEQEGKPISMNSIIGAQAQIEKKMASEIGLLQARALGLQGRLKSAQASADRAVDLKYSQIENNIKIYEAQLNALTPILNKEESIRAQAQALMLADQKQKIADAKAEEKQIQSLALQAINAGAGQDIVDSISNSGSYNEALSKYSQIETTPERDTQVVTAGGRSLLINKQTGETIRDLGGAYKTSGGGSGTTLSSFKFSSDDVGRLLAVGFSNTEANQIQKDINEYGVDITVEGLPENQAKAIRNIASGITPTQEQAQDEPDKITEAKRKVIGGINALMSDNASMEEIEEYIKLKGYNKSDFSDLLNNYTPAVQDKKWWEFWK